MCVVLRQNQLIGIQIRFGFAVFKVNYSNLCDFNHHRSCVYSSLSSQFSLSHTLSVSLNCLKLTIFFMFCRLVRLSYNIHDGSKKSVFLCARLSKEKERKKENTHSIKIIVCNNNNLMLFHERIACVLAIARNCNSCHAHVH